jgi:hypothetical protein
MASMSSQAVTRCNLINHSLQLTTWWPLDNYKYMCYNVWCHSGLWIFGLCASSGILRNTIFQKLDLFLSSSEREDNPYSVMVRWLRLGLSNGHNRVGASTPFTWGRKQIQIPKCCVLWHTEQSTNSENAVFLRVTPQPEPFRTDLHDYCLFTDRM